MSNLANLVIAGLVSGAIYAIFAICITVWFRVSNVLNLAIGDFAMLGAIGVATLVQSDHISLSIAIVVLLVVASAIAWVFDWAVLHFALDRGAGVGLAAMFFFTFALSSIIEGVAQHVFGTNTFAAPAVWPGPAFSVATSIHIERPGIIVVLVAVAVGGLLGAFLHFTVAGKAASACGESVIGARIVGIDSQKLRRRLFMGTAAVAALFGIVESPITGFVYSSGPTLSLMGVIAAGLVGFRRPWRALAVGLVLGVMEALIGGYVSTEFNDVILYALITTVILVRPEVLGLSNVPI